MTLYLAPFFSPLGWMSILASAHQVMFVSVPLPTRSEAFRAARMQGPDVVPAETEMTQRVVQWLQSYFLDPHTVRAEQLPLAAEGTQFERSVWEQVSAIPPGETRSYGEIAQRIGAPRAARAVGRANGRNPWAIVVPCHRVVGAQGALVGYGGGLDTKRRLLEYERGTLEWKRYADRN